jgi:hypothetical protein
VTENHRSASPHQQGVTVQMKINFATEMATSPALHASNRRRANFAATDRLDLLHDLQGIQQTAIYCFQGRKY